MKKFDSHLGSIFLFFFFYFLTFSKFYTNFLAVQIRSDLTTTIINEKQRNRRSNSKNVNKNEKDENSCSISSNNLTTSLPIVRSPGSAFTPFSSTINTNFNNNIYNSQLSINITNQTSPLIPNPIFVLNSFKLLSKVSIYHC